MCWYKRFRWGCGCIQGIMLWNRCAYRGTPQCRRRHLLERYHVSRYCQRHHLEALRFAAEAADYERSHAAISHTTTAADETTTTGTTTGTTTINNTPTPPASNPTNSTTTTAVNTPPTTTDAENNTTFAAANYSAATPTTPPSSGVRRNNINSRRGHG
ncbi:hypothetical protein F5144DRAFT_542533 [Chaetomium tenue]|uniref:Uncharacterized protein n=1 Tax=Chaetomium tenue TaxID=1854479 RepID=A0ACB7PJE0_9PEZI|nr:hypothetical protein F5144DRAFT_542533 [Chaetomium globosum]